MNDRTVRIDSLPLDDKTYVVTKYGGVIKNHGYASDIPLIKVTLNAIENDEMREPTFTCLVGLPELSIVRIGTLWKNQIRQEYYWDRYKRYEEKINLTFNLKKNPAKSVRYIKIQNGLSSIELDDSNKLNEYDENEFHGSSFTELTSDDGIKYIVPSVEILMSTYLPRNKLIRSDLLLYPMDVVLKNYVNDHECKDELYRIYLDKKLEYETMAFLSCMACNKKARSNISKIWSSIEGGSSNERHISVLPYHPESISFKASGVWINDSMFYIQRIYRPKPPSEITFKPIANRYTIAPKERLEDDGGQEETEPSRVPLNQNQVKGKTGVTHKRGPSAAAGMKYIVSEVEPDNDDLDMEVTENIVVNEAQNNSYDNQENEVNTASSGKLSNDSGSQKVARTKYVIEENPDRLDYIVEIENALNELLDKGIIKSIKYIDDNAEEHDALVYASLGEHHINLGESKYWASGYVKGSGIKKSKAGYRKLFIVKVELEGLKPFYIIEIIRKVKSDAFKGIIFQIENDIDEELLEKIKQVIAINKGHFTGDKSKPFTVKKSALYKHTWGKMKERFENVFEAIKVKEIFN